MLQLRGRVSARNENDRQRESLPCSPKKVVLDSPKEIFTLLVWAASIEITKQVEMGKVLGFVAHFLPTGLVACASKALVNAVLDLMTRDTTRQIQGEGTKL